MTSPARARLREALQQMAVALRPLLAEAVPLPATEDYDVVRADFVNRLGDAFLAYVSTTRGAADKRGAMRALLEDVPAAFYKGYQDGGAGEVETDDNAWMVAQTRIQLAWLDKTFADLKAQRDAETATESALRNRAEVWGVTLDGIYSEGKIRGSSNLMLTFKRRPGAKPSKQPCGECTRYDGKRHGARWWVKRDLIRRNGNEHYGCGRWATCTHSFFTDDGELYAE